MRQNLGFLVLAALALPVFLGAQEPFPRLQVVPWNGHKAAASLTFDGSDTSQLDVAIPELTQRHLHATFFLTANRTTRKDEWRGILPAGNEIGNHSLDDFWAGNSIPPNAESEVVGAKNVLQKEFGINLYSFAYPSIPITTDLEALVAKGHLFARGGDGKTDILTPSREPDWMDIPSRGTGPKVSTRTYGKWVEECFRKGGWLVWRIGGLEGAPPDRQPLSKRAFNQILSALQSKDIWVGTFLEIGSYFRAQKIFEKAATAVDGKDGREKWTWQVPPDFPKGVTLKIRFDKKMKVSGSWLTVYPDDCPGEVDGRSAYTRVRQGKNLLRAGADGVYSIHFDAQELETDLTFIDADESQPESGKTPIQ